MSFFPSHPARREQRYLPRHELSYPAYIDIGHGALHRNCLISNLSEAGARVDIGELVDVPEEFVLVIRRRCRVIHRSGGQIGVQFVPGA